MHVTVLDDATIVVGVDHVMHVVIIVSLIGKFSPWLLWDMPKWTLSHMISSLYLLYTYKTVDVRYVLPVEAEAAEMLVTGKS